METKFKAGDKFIPRKPKVNNTKLVWVEQMDKYDGKVLIVDALLLEQYPICGSWTFHPDWCEKVSSSEIPNNHNQFPEVGKMVEPMKAGIEGISDEHIGKSENMVEGLKQYFKNTSKEEVLKAWEATKEGDFPIYNHIKASKLSPQPQNLSTEIDWEQRRYELVKEFMAAIIAQHLTPLRNWDEVVRITGECIEAADEMIKQLKGE